jgi:hypothetical protein
MLYQIESSFSNEISGVVGYAPPVSNLSATPSAGQFILTWPKLDADVTSYRIYYKTNYADDYHGVGLTLNDNPAPSPITILASSLGDPINPSITLGNVIPGQPYWFKIVAVDNSNNESHAATTLTNNVNITAPLSGGGGGGGAALLPVPKAVATTVNQSTKSIHLSWE